MNTDKKVLYIISGIFSGILLLCCLVPKNSFSNLALSLILMAFAAIFLLFLKKRSILNIHFRQVAFIMGGIALLVITLYYLSGLYFGFTKLPLPNNLLIRYIIPFIISAVSAEAIRRTLISAESKFANAVSFICLTVFDILLLAGQNVFKSHSSFMDFVSVAVFPSVTANILYNYLSKRYGAFPNTIYRILISLYPFLSPIQPKIPEALLGLLRVILPLLIIGFIRILYEPKKFSQKRKSKIALRISLSIFLFLSVGLIMLTSCRFKYGLLVIATESMTGSINKGDAIIYEEYDGSALKEGQIIVFGDQNGSKTVHRIEKIEMLDGGLRVYTKGDANQDSDQGFRTADDIIGTVNLKIKYLGYPTVWMRELFE